MARSIPKLLHHHLHQIASLPPWLTLSVAAFVGIVSVFSMVMFLCGSHGEKRIRSKRVQCREPKTERLGDQNHQRVFARLQSSVSSKALLLTSKMRMLSLKKVVVQDDEEEYCVDDDQGAVWKKTIIKGEKCRPLNFSGKILYDSDGNRLPDSPAHPPK